MIIKKNKCTLCVYLYILLNKIYIFIFTSLFSAGHSKVGIECSSPPRSYPRIILGNRRLPALTPKTPPLRCDGRYQLGWDTRLSRSADDGLGPPPLPGPLKNPFEPYRDLFSMENMAKWRAGGADRLGRHLKHVHSPEATGEERFLSKMNDSFKRVETLKARAEGTTDKLPRIRHNPYFVRRQHMRGGRFVNWLDPART